MKKIFSLFAATIVAMSLMASEVDVMSIDFTQGMGDWTTGGFIGFGDVDIWQQSSSYGMKATAYINGERKAVDAARLISPNVDLIGNYVSAKLTFTQAMRYGDASQLSVRANYGYGESKTLSVSNWPDGSNWNFVTSEADISALIGQPNVNIEFIYSSTTSQAATWEIKTVTVTVQINDKCGDNLTWTLDENGTLTISGTGDMYNYDYDYYQSFPYNINTPWDRSSIRSIVIENGVTSIGDYAFSMYGSSESENTISSVIIPNTVTRIGSYSFEDCYNISSVTIPSSIMSIGREAFAGCNGLDVHISDLTTWCNTTISGNPFYCQTGNPIPGILHNQAYNLYLNETLITDLNIPNSITNIEGYFKGCKSIISVTIPSSVTTIQGAFEDCFNLTVVTITNGTNIGDSYAFKGTLVNEIHFIGTVDEWIAKAWSSTFISTAYDLYIGEGKLVDLVVSDGTRSINEAFRGCTSIKTVTIPVGVKIIAENAFSGCTSIQTITSYDQRPPTVQTGALDGIDYSTIVYVPAEYLETYQLHDVWGLFDVRPIETHEAIDEVAGKNAKSTNKLLRDGQLFILRADKTYTLTGQEIK